jgi:hypothetical protein
MKLPDLGILHGYEAVYAAHHDVKTNGDAVKHANGRHRVYSVSLDHEELINLAGNSKAGCKFLRKLN